MAPKLIFTDTSTLLNPQGPKSFLREFDFTLSPYSGCAFQCGGAWELPVSLAQAKNPTEVSSLGQQLEQVLQAWCVLEAGADNEHGSIP